MKLLLVSILIPLYLAPAVSLGQPQKKNGTGQKKTATANNSRGKGGSGLGNYTEPPPANNVPEQVFNIVLGRPTDHEVSIHTLFYHEATAYLVYGSEPDKLEMETTKFSFHAREAHDFLLNGLQPNRRYYYRLIYQIASGTEQTSEEYSFHTQRSAGTPFVFTVSADSHLDENTSGDVYLRTLANAASDSPDFHLELGDTFMTGKYIEPELSEPQYFAQRYYLGSLCHSTSLFFVLGNHDGESGNQGSMNWATKTRKQLFPNPEPNHFYTGNQIVEHEVGLPQNYYQWTWGDAQFIVLDPFR